MSSWSLSSGSGARGDLVRLLSHLCWKSNWPLKLMQTVNMEMAYVGIHTEEITLERSSCK